MTQKGIKTFLIIFLALALPLALGGLLLREMQNLKKELALTQGEISLLEAKLKNIKALKNVLEESQAQRAAIDELFIDGKSLVRFIESLEEGAQASQVELKVSSAVLPQKPEELGPTFRLQAEGGFKNLFQFLYLLETLPAQVVLDRVEFLRNPAGDKIQGRSWTSLYQLRVISYVF